MADSSKVDGDLSLSQYDQLRVIGAGGFGRALLVRRKIDAAVLVLKEVSLAAIGGDKFREMARLEAEILSTFSHPNIIQIFKFFEESGCLYLELEYCEGGDLDYVIDGQRDKGELFPEEKICFWFAQLADTVNFLHDRKILHRDIKAQNVFITDNGDKLKLGDFGICKILDQTAQVVTTRIGTCTHFSPEFCEDNPYDAKADVWALGIILYQLATLNLPYDGANELQIYKKIMKGMRDPVPELFSIELRQLIDNLLAQDSNDRFSVKEALADRWLAPGLAELAKRRDAAAEEASKAKELYLKQLAPFETNYWSTLVKLDRKADADSSDTRWFISPCGIMELLSFGDIILVVCSLGEVIAMASVSPFRCRTEPSVNGSSSFVTWRSRIAVPEPVRKSKAHLHCAADERKSRIYITFEDRDGIFFVELKQLATAKSSQSAVVAASAFGATFADYRGLTAVEPRTFVRGRLPWPKEREFWGVSCHSEHRLVLCCDHNIKQNIGIWSAEDGHFLAEIGYNTTAPSSLSSKCNPFRCAIHFLNRENSPPNTAELTANSLGSSSLTALIVASDRRNSRLHFFKAIFVPSNSGAKFESSDWVKSDIRKGKTSGLVRYPQGVSFDNAGNLWVADSGSYSVQLFSTIGMTFKSLCTLPTSSKGWTMAVRVLVDPFDNFQPYVLAGMHGGVDHQRVINCYSTPPPPNNESTN